MTFFKYSQPACWLLALGVISATAFALIPEVRDNFPYGMAILSICFGLIALYAFWVDWKALQKRRNTFNVEPFKARLERFHQRRNMQKGK